GRGKAGGAAAGTATVDTAALLTPVDVIDLMAPPVVRPAPVPIGLKVVLRPRDLSVTLRSVPYKLDKVAGQVTVLPDKVIVEDVAGEHGAGTVRVAGTGTTDGRAVWDLKLAGHDLDVDDALKRALPPTLASMFESLKVGGRIGFMLPRFVYHGPPTPTAAPGAGPIAAVAPAPAGAAAGAQQPPGPDIDFGGAITLSGATLDVGVP